MEQALSFIVDFVEHFGYLGIFIMTFLESTFAPIPSEVTMIPVGYLIYQGQMNPGIAFACSVVGTLGGSLFNYWIAIHYGRRILIKYGRYFLMDEKKLGHVENFFRSHGPISIFSGRLIPGVRHFISFPAGLSRMALKPFILYTTFGGSLWMATLMALGYFIGHNKERLHHYIHLITWSIFGALVVLAAGYVWRYRRKKSQQDDA